MTQSMVDFELNFATQLKSLNGKEIGHSHRNMEEIMDILDSSQSDIEILQAKNNVNNKRGEMKLISKSMTDRYPFRS